MGSWMVPLLGGIVGVGVIAIYLVSRAWARRSRLTPEQRQEVDAAPMPRLQKRALVSFLLGAATLGLISAILMKYGAAEYWANDDLRLTVVLIFLAGMAMYVGTLLVMVNPLSSAGAGLDERDRKVLAQASAVQSAMVLVALAIWTTALGQWFHEEGAVPMVYMYLIFGTVVLVNWIGHAAGIVLGYWMGSRFAES